MKHLKNLQALRSALEVLESDIASVLNTQCILPMFSHFLLDRWHSYFSHAVEGFEYPSCFAIYPHREYSVEDPLSCSTT